MTTNTRSYGVGRTEQVQFRVTPIERAALHAEARNRGFSTLSDFARYVCLEALPDPDDAREKELSELETLEASFHSLANSIRARHGMGGKGG